MERSGASDVDGAAARGAEREAGAERIKVGNGGPAFAEAYGVAGDGSPTPRLRRGRSEVGGQLSEFEIVVRLVGADPEPVVIAIALASDGAVAAADFNAVNPTFLFEP